MLYFPPLNFKNFINEWDTKRGLFYNIHIILISISVFSGLVYFELVSFYVAKILILIPNLIFLVFWIAKRGYLYLSFSKKLNVVFALDLEQKSKSTTKVYKETLEELKRRILENNLQDIIKISEKPKDTTFKSKTAAEAKTEMGLPGSVLLIWGGITERSQRYKLFFSYEFGYPGKEQGYYQRVFNKKVDKVLAKNLWSYAGPDSVEVIAQDFLEVVYFIFGLTMATIGNFDKSISLFENFLEEWRNLSDLVKKRNLGPASMEAKGILARTYLNYAELGRYQGKYEKVNFYAQKAFDINYDQKSNYGACLFLAIYYEEELGDIEQAKKWIKKAEEIAPPRNELYRFGEAYFAINDYNFKLALEIYDEISRWTHDTNYNEIRRSLFEKYGKTKNLGFLFAEIYIAYIFQNDDSYAGKGFKKFIKQAEKNKDTYDLLITKAKDILIAIKKIMNK